MNDSAPEQDDGRDESEAERLDRDDNELLLRHPRQCRLGRCAVDRAGLACLAVAILSAVVLVLSFIGNPLLAGMVGVVLAATVVVTWVVLPGSTVAVPTRTDAVYRLEPRGYLR